MANPVKLNVAYVNDLLLLTDKSHGSDQLRLRTRSTFHEQAKLFPSTSRPHLPSGSLEKGFRLADRKETDFLPTLPARALAWKAAPVIENAYSR